MPACLKKCIHSIENAVSHDMVGGAVLRLCSYLAICGPHDVSHTLHSLNWKEAIHRYIYIFSFFSSLMAVVLSQNLVQNIHFSFLFIFSQKNIKSFKPKIGLINL